MAKNFTVATFFGFFGVVFFFISASVKLKFSLCLIKPQKKHASIFIRYTMDDSRIKTCSSHANLSPSCQ